MKKKALIYSPYLEALGGGERYCLTVAEYLLARGWRVDFFWDKKGEIEKIGKKLNLEVEKSGVTGKKAEQLSFFQRFKLTRKYDLVFWLSDGSIPSLFGKKNWLHFQRPFFGVRRKNPFNQLKLKLIDKIICNSKFTKKFIDREFRVDSLVVYPPVDVEKFKPGKKENIILAVGRFEEFLRAKRQDVLVQAFKKMVDQGLKDWKFVLIGGSLSKPEENQFLKELKKEAQSYPVDFLVNVGFETLRQYCGKAKIFWHAAGYGVDQEKEPWLAEHFGITPVEAMAAGSVPVVIDKGGLKEIVRRGEGERWRGATELISQTKKLIKSKNLYQKYQKRALARSKRFSKKIFYRQLGRLLIREEK